MINPQVYGAAALPAMDRPQAVEALYATGFQLHQQERFAEAATMFRLMLQLIPTEERGWLALGECHRSAGHRLIACELLGTGMVVAAPAPRCALLRALCLRELGREAEADLHFDQALESAEGDLELCLTIERARRDGRG